MRTFATCAGFSGGSTNAVSAYHPGSELPSKIEVGGTVRQVLTGTLSDF